MKTLKSDIENFRKLLNDLGYAKDAISDIQTMIRLEKYETNEDILDDILSAKDFFVNMEKHLKEWRSLENE